MTQDQDHEDAALIRLAIRRHIEAAHVLLGAVQELRRPWNEEYLARRAVQAAEALGKNLAINVRENRSAAN